MRDEHGVDVPYSSLTRLIRQQELREKKERIGRFVFEPGEEMQHDTSPHCFVLGEKRITAQCASLVLAYSRRIFIQYFPVFTRFEAKVFLTNACRFMEGASRRCVIDNSSVIVASGSGANAKIAPEMEAFGTTFGFSFIPHAVRRPQRKGQVERQFHYVENNFLVGRHFSDWEDLNAQALQWCNTFANQKVKRSLGKTPEAAYLMERRHLTALPAYIPPVFQIEHRVVDLEGYINFETNRYSVPERLLGKSVEIHKHYEKLSILFKRQTVAEHLRQLGKRGKRITTPGHHKSLKRKTLFQKPPNEENLLTGVDPVLDQYVVDLKKKAPGRGATQLRRLLELKRTYPEAPFLAAVRIALQYGLFDLARLEQMILKQVAGDFFALGES